MAVNVPQDVGVHEYFEELYPRIFAERLGTPPQDMSGFTLACTFDVTGDGGAVYGVRSMDGTRVEIERGGYGRNDIRVDVDLASWRNLVTGALSIPDPLIMYNTPERNQKVKAARGALTIEVTMPDGSLTTSTTRYGESNEPNATVRAKADDYNAFLEGRLRPEIGFLLRKIKISGSIQFLMLLNTLQQ